MRVRRVQLQLQEVQRMSHNLWRDKSERIGPSTVTTPVPTGMLRKTNGVRDLSNQAIRDDLGVGRSTDAEQDRQVGAQGADHVCKYLFSLLL